MINIDGHVDIAWNMLRFKRDYSRSAAETRRLEEGTETPSMNGSSLLGYPEWLKGRVGVMFATLFSAPARFKLGEWDIYCYQNIEEAYQRYLDNLDMYQLMTQEHPDKFRLIFNRSDLDSVIEAWNAWDQGAREPPIGLVLLMEGAEGVRVPSEIREWYQAGLRIVGLTWVSTHYAGGTREPGPLTEDGKKLLKVMAELNMVLDISHLADESAHQALDLYEGLMIASHSNAAALLDGSLEPDRHLTDEHIRKLIQRQGVIGLAPYNEYLDGAWRMGQGRDGIILQRLVEHVDYVCQMAGDSLHVGIGTDFDGGFGWESVPVEINTIADFPLIGEALKEHGYHDSDVEAILGGNWLRVLKASLPG